MGSWYIDKVEETAAEYDCYLLYCVAHSNGLLNFYVSNLEDAEKLKQLLIDHWVV